MNKKWYIVAGSVLLMIGGYYMADPIKISLGLRVKGKARWKKYADGTFKGYLQFLDNQFKTAKASGLLAKWNMTEFKKAIKWAAQIAGIDPQVMYLIMARESSYSPVGVHGHSWQTALNANSSAYGVTQVVGKTFDSVVFDKVDFDHADLWQPDKAILAGSVVMAENLKAAGGDLYKAVSYYRCGKPSCDDTAYVNYVVNNFNKDKGKEVFV